MHHAVIVETVLAQDEPRAPAHGRARGGVAAISQRIETGTRCSLGGADGPPGRCRAGSSCTTPSIVETVLAHDEPRAPGHGRARGWRRSASGLRLALIQAAALKVRAETGKGMTV